MQRIWRYFCCKVGFTPYHATMTTIPFSFKSLYEKVHSTLGKTLKWIYPCNECLAALCLSLWYIVGMYQDQFVFYIINFLNEHPRQASTPFPEFVWNVGTEARGNHFSSFLSNWSSQSSIRQTVNDSSPITFMMEIGTTLPGVFQNQDQKYSHIHHVIEEYGRSPGEKLEPKCGRKCGGNPAAQDLQSATLAGALSHTGRRKSCSPVE